MLGEVVRTKEEIKELCEEIQTHRRKKSLQFELLTYEEGVLAAISWLSYSTARLPTEIPNNKNPAIESVVYGD